jgi:hypothetical protein
MTQAYQQLTSLKVRRALSKAGGVFISRRSFQRKLEVSLKGALVKIESEIHSERALEFEEKAHALEQKARDASHPQVKASYSQLANNYRGIAASIRAHR